MPKEPKNTRGGSRKGKTKPGISRKGWSHSMRRMSTRKALKRD